MNQTKSHSNINTVIKNNLDKFIAYLHLELQSDNKKYSGICPIHADSDNINAFIMYKNTGIWMCNTHHCEQIFSRYPIGFIKGILSNKNGWQCEQDQEKIVSNYEVDKFVNSIISSNNIKSFTTPPKSSPEISEKSKFIRQIALLKNAKKLNNRENFRKQAIIPSDYYLKRNFSREILDKYDVGILTDPYHSFYNRTVIPIYDTNYQYILGYTSRSIFEKCIICGTYHDLNKICPINQDYNKNNKWEHSKGFKKESCLYNIWFAQKKLKDSLIICEGPSHCWRLSEAGYDNSVAIFGSSISQYQTNIIKKLNINKIILPWDVDAAGDLTRQQIKKMLGGKFDYQEIMLSYGDIADASIDEIKDLLK